MNAEQVYSDIQKLPLMAGSIRKREGEAITFLQVLYKQVTGTTVYAGCKNCHIKAANYLMSLTLQQLQTMSEQKFKLKKGVSIEWPYRSGQRITEANITDATAAEYLYNNPQGAHFFDVAPDSLEDFYPSEEVSAAEPKKGRKAAKETEESNEDKAE